MGSNPTPSATPPYRPQTLINTRVRVFEGGRKRAFLGQVSLKVSLLGIVGGLPDPTRKQLCDYSQIAPSREPQHGKFRPRCFAQPGDDTHHAGRSEAVAILLPASGSWTLLATPYLGTLEAMLGT